MKTENVAEQLDDINETLKKLVKVTDRPDSSFQNVSSIVGTIASVLAVVEVVDTIMEWF
jgi:methyl-accepting chemotaxis protein